MSFGQSVVLSLCAAGLGLVLLAAPAKAEVTLDSSFGVNGIAWTDFGSGNSDMPRDLVIQPDGKILTAGKSDGPGGTNYIAISRHSTDGALDPAGFGVDGKVLQRFELRDYANAIALQEDGKIVAAGMQMTSTGVSTHRPTAYRFHADGTVDTTFGDGGYVAIWSDYSTGENAAVKVLPDGRILTGGPHHPGYWGGNTGFARRMYLSDGTVQAEGTLLFGIDYNRGSCAFPDDGGILFANLADLNGRREFVMARKDSAGISDQGFGTGGIVQTGIEAVFNTVLRVLVLADGKILLVGTTPGANTSNWTALRFNSDGTPDDLFGTNGRTDVSFGDLDGNSGCYDATIDAGGKILLAGRAGNGQPALARLLSDGNLNSTFSGDGMFTVNLNGGGGTHYFTRVLILPDGRILTAGFGNLSGGGDFFLARFWPSDVTGVDEAEVRPTQLVIHALPNPSHARMTIFLQQPGEQLVNVGIFDVAGREVRRIFDGRLPAGAHRIPWDGRDASGREAPAGVYFAKLSSAGQKQVVKLIRIR